MPTLFLLVFGMNFNFVFALIAAGVTALAFSACDYLDAHLPNGVPSAIIGGTLAVLGAVSGCSFWVFLIAGFLNISITVFGVGLGVLVLFALAFIMTSLFLRPYGL